MTDAEIRANGFPITFARQMAELYGPEVEAQTSRMNPRDDLTAEARVAVLPGVSEGLGSTKRKAVEDAFDYGMHYWFLYDPAKLPRDVVERRMHEHVYSRMTAGWRWWILWGLIGGDVKRLVVALVEYLLTASDWETADEFGT